MIGYSILSIHVVFLCSGVMHTMYIYICVCVCDKGIHGILFLSVRPKRDHSINQPSPISPAQPVKKVKKKRKISIVNI